jgi:hypothetical protein
VSDRKVYAFRVTLIGARYSDFLPLCGKKFKISARSASATSWGLPVWKLEM